jgi:hypothetical protein
MKRDPIGFAEAFYAMIRCQFEEYPVETSAVGRRRSNDICFQVYDFHHRVSSFASRSPIVGTITLL